MPRDETAVAEVWVDVLLSCRCGARRCGVNVLPEVAESSSTIPRVEWDCPEPDGCDEEKD